MNKKKPVLLSVHPEFRNILKVESALKGKTIYDYTKELASENCFVSEYLNAQAEKRRKERKNGERFVFKF